MRNHSQLGTGSFWCYNKYLNRVQRVQQCENGPKLKVSAVASQILYDLSLEHVSGTRQTVCTSVNRLGPSWCLIRQWRLMLIPQHRGIIPAIQLSRRPAILAPHATDKSDQRPGSAKPAVGFKLPVTDGDFVIACRCSDVGLNGNCTIVVHIVQYIYRSFPRI